MFAIEGEKRESEGMWQKLTEGRVCEVVRLFVLVEFNDSEYRDRVIRRA